MIAPLAHAPREQRLAERVVELVRAGVVEVLALEVDRPPEALGEPPRAVQRRGPPAEVAQQPVELGAVGGVRARREPRLLQLGERRHQRLGHVLPAVGAEAVLDAWRSSRPALMPTTVPASIARGRRGRRCTRARGSLRGIRRCPRAKNARSRSGSLCPGAASVPRRCRRAERPGERDRLGDVLGPEPAAEDQRHRGATRGEQAPVERSPRSPRAALACRARWRARRAGGSRCGSARRRARRQPWPPARP